MAYNFSQAATRSSSNTMYNDIKDKALIKVHSKVQKLKEATENLNENFKKDNQYYKRFVNLLSKDSSLFRKLKYKKKVSSRYMSSESAPREPMSLKNSLILSKILPEESRRQNKPKAICDRPKTVSRKNRSEMNDYGDKVYSRPAKSSMPLLDNFTASHLKYNDKKIYCKQLSKRIKLRFSPIINKILDSQSSL